MRIVRRVVSTVALAVALALLPQADAYGGVQWCAEDPILTFSNGAKLQLVGRYDSAHADKVSGPIVWSIEVPSNVSGKVADSLLLNESMVSYGYEQPELTASGRAASSSSRPSSPLAATWQALPWRSR